MVVAVGCSVHAELGGRGAETRAGPETQPALNRLEHIAITGTSLRPVITRHGAGRQQRIIDLPVFGHDPDGRQPDLKIAQWTIQQWPSGGVKTNAETVVVRRRRHAHADVTCKSLGHQLRLINVSRSGKPGQQKQDRKRKSTFDFQFTTGRRTMLRYSMPVWSPCR